MLMNTAAIRREVMQTLEKSMKAWTDKYLRPIEDNWQPADLLPESSSDTFFDEVKEIQALCGEMEHDLFITLIGDTITEEALPTYESWLMGMSGVDQGNPIGWTQWVRSWTAEENRHGDLLNQYLYLSGRVDMRQMQISTQYLIADGFDIQTGNDPYRNFVYTSFQELATNISHRRVASLSKKTGNQRLAKICGVIAADEARHAAAYSNFVKDIFQLDPIEMMLAFEDMMRKKIIMPAHFMRQSGQQPGELYADFSDAAQRAGVYTTQDYIDIMNDLLKDWNLENIRGLNDKAERARDYLLNLPGRLQRIAERITISEASFQFNWIKY